MTGTVFLVGAGPGDPGLLTLAGRDALAAADILFYDALVDPATLAHCSPHCEKVFVGKRADRHFVIQSDTNALLVAAAREGKTVVRLKGGDPMVFGRGGEECAVLAEAGIPFVVVPGVTSAIAAPTYAGIPVTHRDAASSFAVVTGHERGDRGGSTERAGGEAEGRRRWDRIAHAADTLLFLMGVESLDEIAARLMEHGRSPQTPVAVIQWGTWTRQRVATGTLTDIAGIVRDAGITAPAVTVVGDVVRYRAALRWFDNRPLSGRRVVVTRAREQASTLAARLRALGAEPIEFAGFALTDPEDGYAALDAALQRLSDYAWVVFTSANGVAATFARLAAAGRDTRAFGAAKVAAIGPGTAAALAVHGIRPDFVPSEFVAEAVLTQFPETELTGKRILIPRAADARELLPETWRAAGALVDVAPAYRSVPTDEGVEALRAELAAGRIDAITFASAATVRNVVAALGAEAIPPSVVLAAIGPVTAQACTDALRPPDVVAESHTLDGLTAALRERLVR